MQCKVGLIGVVILCQLAVGAACANARRVAEPDEFGLMCIGQAYFPAPEEARPLAVPNGNFEEVIENWPTGGWCVPNRNGIAQAVATLAELKQRVPKPAEVAEAMQITLGEYDYIHRRVGDELVASPWRNPAPAEEAIRLVLGARGQRHQLPVCARMGSE